MARIKRKGLDYFPLDTTFIHNRLVRRLLKARGDAALSVLIGTLGYIYAGEGYYIGADADLYADLSNDLFETSVEEVEAILRTAVDYGIFHAELFERYGILTSEEVQRQYLYCIKRRSVKELRPEFRLIAPQENEGEPTPTISTAEDDAPKRRAGRRASRQTDAEQSTEDEARRAALCLPVEPSRARVSTLEGEGEARSGLSVGSEVGSEDKGRDEYIQTVTQCIPNADSTAPHVTQCIPKRTKQSTAKHSTAQLLPQAPPLETKGGAGSASEVRAEEGAEAVGKGRVWTRHDIARLQPPTDGQRRNFSGLVAELARRGVPWNEQYALICKSNFGLIGHPLWLGLAELRAAGGKIKQPGRFLLSRL